MRPLRFKTQVLMKMLREFDIPFSGLKQGKHEFSFNVEGSFFEAFDYNEFNNAAVTTNVALTKSSTMPVPCQS